MKMRVRGQEEFVDVCKSMYEGVEVGWKGGLDRVVLCYQFSSLCM